MKIIFNKEDFLKFFNMISIYKTYAEVADKVDVEPPRSAIDLLLYKLASLAIEHNWYETTIDTDYCFPIIQFMLGMGKVITDEDVTNAFNIPGQTLKINIDELWKYILQNGIEV